MMKFKWKPRPDSLTLACLRSVFTLTPSFVLHSTTLSCRLGTIATATATDNSCTLWNGVKQCPSERKISMHGPTDECEATNRNNTEFYIHSSTIKACWLLVMDQVLQSKRTRISASERSFIVRLGHGEDAFAKKSHYHAILRQATFTVSQYGQYLGR